MASWHREVAMGKGRRLRAGRVVERSVAARRAAESPGWSDIETLLPPAYGAFPPTRTPRGAEGRPPNASQVLTPTLERRTRHGRECAELSRLAVERDELRGRLAEAEREIVAQVSRERRAGASWGDVGRALGMSRQGARQRFGPE
jgi:hypothetical protein